MFFETSSTTETGLLMIDGVILESFRRRVLNESPLIRRNPRWVHRNVNNMHHGNGRFQIEISGLVAVHTISSRMVAYVTASAFVYRSKGWNSPGSVEGYYTDRDPRYDPDAFKHTLEKKKFSKNW